MKMDFRNSFGLALPILFLLCFSLKTYALKQTGRQWLGVNAAGTLDADHKWHHFIFSQLRVNDYHPEWDLILVEGGIGYQQPHHSFWAGYRFSLLTPYHHTQKESRLFQQMLLEHELANTDRLVYRMRFEEMIRNQQLGVRLRQRVSLSIKNYELFSHAYPFLYEEVFCELKHTNFLPHTFLGENRIYLGFDWYCSKTTWWDIGYLNQYIIHSPNQSQNRMNHVISMTYNFS